VRRPVARCVPDEPPAAARRRQTVDVALNIQQRVDPLDRFQGDRREDLEFATLGAASHTGLDIGEDEELAPSVGPAGGLDESRPSHDVVQLAVTTVGVSLQDAAPIGQALLGMLAEPVARVEEHRSRRCPPTERPVIAHIGPTSPDDGLAPGQHRHRGVVAKQTVGGQDVSQKAIMDGPQHRAARPNLIGQRGETQRHTLGRVALGLAVEMLMLALLLEQDHRQKAGAGPASGHDVETAPATG